MREEQYYGTTMVRESECEGRSRGPVKLLGK